MRRSPAAWGRALFLRLLPPSSTLGPMLVRSATSSMVCLTATLLLATASAHAQEIALNPEANGGKTAKRGKGQLDATEHPPGTYAGVKPGGAAPPGTLAKPGAQPVEITWPGFQMQPDGSSRVFLQTTVPLDGRPVMAGNKLTMDLGNALIVGASRFPLYTQFFNTPVTRVEIRRARKHTTLEITLRTPIEPRISNERAASGFQFLYLDFPAGDYLPKTASVERQGAPPPPPHPEGPGYDDPPSHIDGEPGPSASASTAMDAELPPGMAKPKGKAKAKAKRKASSSMRVGM